ncbi:MAG TPA: DUF58 domain-containing protein [Chloroflexota bacterium]|nr:DUF58 domain-containing protein [Chloroflexota bacterium]
MPNVVFVALVLVFLAASFRISFFYFVLYFFVLAWLLARVWVWRAWRALEISRQFEDHVFLGETATLRMRLHNGGRLPIPWVRVEDKLPQRLTAMDAFRAVVSLLPRETRTLEYTIPASRRGYYPVGPMQIVLGDVFGFYTRAMSTAVPAYLTVYPKILPIQQLGLPSKSAFGTLRTHEILYEDPARVVGVREYVPGDSLRKVNWKVSAAMGRLQVKKLEPAITLDTLIFLNLNLEEYDLAYAEGASELAISVAASLAVHLGEQRQPVGLISNGRDMAVTDEPAREEGPRGLSARLPWEVDRRGVDELGFATPDSLIPRERPTIAVAAGKGRSHVMRVLEALARAQLRNGQPLPSLLRQQAVRLAWGSTVVVVTWGRAMGLNEALIGLRKSGYNVVVLLVRFGIRDTYPAELAALGIQVYEIRSEQDATLAEQHRIRVAV